MPVLAGVAGVSVALLFSACLQSALPAPALQPRMAAGLPAARVAWASDGRYVMGTVLELTLPVRSGEVDRAQEMLERCFVLAAELDGLLSRFDPESDVSRLNAHAGDGRLLRIDSRTAELLGFSRRATALTRSSFDVTVSPLIGLWSAAARSDRVPEAHELAGALRLVGADRIRLEPDGRAGLDLVGMSVDLGGVAKGFALDAIAARIREAGMSQALLSFGKSSVWALGAPPDGSGWRLLLESPDAGYAGVIELADLALSVSSSLGQSSEIAGRRYGHVIDPRSGWPLVRGKQAAVVARSASLAEVLSTALLILSEEDGRAVLETQAAEARVVDDQGRTWETRGWQRTTKFEPVAGASRHDRRFAPGA